MLVGMKAYSIDLRQKILRASDQRLGYQRAIATLCGLSQSFVGKLLRRRRAICDASAMAHVRRLVHEHTEATLAALATPLEAQHGLHGNVPTMGRIVLHLKLPRNQSRSTLMSATLNGSSRHARSSRMRSRRSTPRASSSSMHRASTSR